MSLLLLTFAIVGSILGICDGGELSKTWSNRFGSILTPIATGIWSADRPFIWNNIDVGGRMTVARVGDDLMVHSPVEWTEELSKVLSSLGGSVKHIIAPNYEHLRYTEQWSKKYPDAFMYACPGLPPRMPEVNFDFEFGKTDVDGTFLESVEFVWMNCETNPATGRPFFNEIVFYHKQSKTLMASDSLWNYPEGSMPNFYGIEGIGTLHECPKVPLSSNSNIEVKVPFGTRLWKAGMDKVYLPFYKRFMIRGKIDEYHIAVDKILSWDVETIGEYEATYVYMYACMYVCIYVCMHVCMYVCMCVCIKKHPHSHRSPLFSLFSILYII